jgi:hypothetical protein
VPRCSRTAPGSALAESHVAAETVTAAAIDIAITRLVVRLPPMVNLRECQMII